MNGKGILSQEAIGEFKQAYQSEFGEALSEDEAQEIALRVLRLFDLLSRPSPAWNQEPPLTINR